MAKFVSGEIPLGQGKPQSLISWIIALMIYLGTLSLTGAVLSYRLVESKQGEVKNTFVAVLQAADGMPAAETSSSERTGFPADLAKALRSLPGVINITSLSSQGKSVAQEDQAASSQGFEVTLSPQTKANLAAFEEELRPVFPTVSLRHSQPAQETLLTLSRSFLGLSLLVVSCIGFISVMTIAFITYSGLAIHENVIRILRLMGADHRFIAKQFQTYSLKLATRGGVIGALLSALTYLGMSLKFKSAGIDFFQMSSYEREIGAVIVLTPLFMMAIVMASARMTVLFSMEED